MSVDTKRIGTCVPDDLAKLRPSSCQYNVMHSNLRPYKPEPLSQWRVGSLYGRK